MSASTTLSSLAGVPTVLGDILFVPGNNLKLQPAMAVDQSSHTIKGDLIHYHIVVRSSVSNVPGSFDLFVVVERAISAALVPFEVMSTGLSIALEVLIDPMPPNINSAPSSQRTKLPPISIPIDLARVTAHSVYMKSFSIPKAGRSSRLMIICATVSYHTVVDSGRKNAFFLDLSPFFADTYRCREAAHHDDSSRPLSFDWSAHAVVAFIVHIYTDWLPGQSLPDSTAVRRVCAKYSLDFGHSDRHVWMETLDLAKMLGLTQLERATNRLVVSLLNNEYQTLLAACASEIQGE
ncbi:hypothetical protein BCR44DRAFT_48336 [Catenaria anguillulae PL171]|uniref:Uncharacterized protein n=1 Tax=Catenaria anguillulae PL171 TaxID=765915 RepID=A0A1Y2HGV7_9FUNG|nr:hypothetical protein BCR44DRAFT_48336 [Catenaria anguillulae PL171]